MSTPDDTRPTARERLLYLAFGLTPWASSREWVRRDIASRSWLIRRAGQTLLGGIVGLFIAEALFQGVDPASSGASVSGILLGAGIGLCIAILLQMTVLADFLRRRALAYYEKRWERQVAS